MLEQIRVWHEWYMEAVRAMDLALTTGKDVPAAILRWEERLTAYNHFRDWCHVT